MVYALGCQCQLVYVGSTVRPLKLRIQEHRRAIIIRDPKYPMTEHYNIIHPRENNFWFHAIEQVQLEGRGGNRELMLRRAEAKWICRLRTVQHGHNTDNEMHYFL